MRVKHGILICFIMGMLCLSCGKKNAEHEISSLMDRRESAFNNKKLDSYLKLFSNEYKDKKGGIDALRERMKKSFSMFKTIHFTHANRDIFVEGINAKIVQNFTLTFVIGYEGKEEKHSVKDKEKFELKKINSNWLIVAGE